ncbi:PsbP-related protein [Aneurinibacillus terranovensis]|uniref:PsbP-related protein n=1 Tax=Aneurinibacillus terranovensis TaxID=278991 RepID=UPI000412C685|nr:PsbP-related protein [Aneurinibacillus terranovensis]
MKMKMGITALALILIFLLAGCGSKQLSTTSSTDNSTHTNQVSTTNSNQSSTTSSSDNGGSPKSEKATNQENPVKSNEKPLPPEKNPVGDIPDSQAFVNYTSNQGGYSIAVPEGWSRTENGADARFVDKFDGVKTTIGTDARPFTLDNIKNNQVKDLIANGRAIKIVEIKEVTLPGGKSVVVKYNSNSDPNPVTNKQIRLENETFYFNKNGKIGSLTVWAPLGSDNVDQWKKISESWRWK